MTASSLPLWITAAQLKSSPSISSGTPTTSTAPFSPYFFVYMVRSYSPLSALSSRFLLLNRSAQVYPVRESSGVTIRSACSARLSYALMISWRFFATLPTWTRGATAAARNKFNAFSISYIPFLFFILFLQILFLQLLMQKIHSPPVYIL